MNWYAIKVFYGRTAYAKRWLCDAGIEYYSQQFIPSLIFVRCNEDLVLKLRWEHYDSLMVYRSADRSHPAPIPEREVGLFRLMVSAGTEGLELLGEDKPRYHSGELVEVTGGPYKGLQGRIVRIRKDRRLVLSITGVAAIATAHIPEALLRRVVEEEKQGGPSKTTAPAQLATQPAFS